MGERNDVRAWISEEKETSDSIEREIMPDLRAVISELRESVRASAERCVEISLSYEGRASKNSERFDEIERRLNGVEAIAQSALAQAVAAAEAAKKTDATLEKILTIVKDPKRLFLSLVAIGGGFEGSSFLFDLMTK